MPDKDKVVIVACAMPPPIHGQSIVNAFLVGELSKVYREAIRVLDISPGSSGRSLSYHSTRIKRVFGAATRIFRNKKRKITLYTVFESGFGRIYNALIFITARLKGAKIIIHHHTSSHLLHNDAISRILIRIAGKKAVHILLSERMRGDFANRYKFVQKTLVLHNAAVIEPGPSRPGAPDCKQIKLGHLSNLSHDKGLDIVIDTFRAVRARGVEAKLFLAGPANAPETVEILKGAKEEFGDELVILGSVTGDKKVNFYHGIDIFLFPSRYRYEAQPLVVLEAISHGCIPLVSAAGYTGEILGNDLRVIDDLSQFAESACEICAKISEDESWRRELELGSISRYAYLRQQSSREVELFVKEFE